MDKIIIFNKILQRVTQRVYLRNLLDYICLCKAPTCEKIMFNTSGNKKQSIRINLMLLVTCVLPLLKRNQE